jgi:hypothetical protein
MMKTTQLWNFYHLAPFRRLHFPGLGSILMCKDSCVRDW